MPVALVCAWCERVRIGAGDWGPAHASGSGPVDVTHGICSDCLARETHAALSGGTVLSLRVEEER